MYRITFVLEALRDPSRDPALFHETLRLMTRALTRVDQDYLREHPDTPPVSISGVQVQDSRLRSWRDIPTMLMTGTGSHEAVSCWHAAEQAAYTGAALDAPAIARPAPKGRVPVELGLFTGEHDREASHRALQAILFALMYADILWLRAHPETPRVYESGVTYQEEPQGQEDWADAPTSIGLGWADCEDLACWRAAELRVRDGIQAKPVFQFKRRPDGGYLYHIQVSYPDGRIEDPSRALGMR